MEGAGRKRQWVEKVRVGRRRKRSIVRRKEQARRSIVRRNEQLRKEEG